MRFFILLLSFALAAARSHQAAAPWDFDKELHLSFQPESPAVENDVRPGPRARFVGANFALHKDIAHGEREIKLFYDGVVAMETVIRASGENALFFREVTDGKNLVSLVYKDADTVADCDVTRDRADVDKFLAHFLKCDVSDFANLRKVEREIDLGNIVGGDKQFSGSDVSLQILDNRALLEPYAHMIDIQDLKANCIAMHRELKRMLHQQGKEIPETAEGGRVKREVGGEEGLRRSKRSMLLYPGTNWCGRGSEAASYDDLGEDANTDRCCRQHDFCPHFIEGFETKYNYFNYRFHTISHCYCDESFRTCLKSSGTEVAEMVGNVYFNVLGMTCFEFRPTKVCAQRSWWGRCVKYERPMQAKVMGALTWN